MLGLLIKKIGYASHTTARASHCKTEMKKLYRFWNLHQHHKSKIYKALILSKITYPPIPTHCLSNTQLQLLQRIHSNGVNLIAGIRRLEHKTSEFTYKKINLSPLNQILHERAYSVWQTIRSDLHPEWEILHQDGRVAKKNWPLSIPSVLAGPPMPKYIY